MGSHDSKILLQQPPQRLTRVQDGNTITVGSEFSALSNSFNGTTVSSGIQCAGDGCLAKLLSTFSPPKRAVIRII